MKIDFEKTKELEKILNKISLPQDSNLYTICFPVDTSTKVREVSGMSLTLVDNKSGTEKKPEPVILYREASEKCAFKGFADLTFARKFDFLLALELLGKKLSKKDEEFFSDLDCYLVHKENLLISFM